MRKIKYGALALIFAVLLSGCAKKSETAKNDYPQSIVALSPASAEILFAVGAGKQISAVSDFTDYPAEATELPKVGGFDGKTLSMEKILSFKPDLVYLTDGMHNFLIEGLEANKIAYYVSTASSIKNLEQEIQQIGELTGHTAEAKKVIAEMNQKISSFRDTSAATPSVYYEVWNAPYMSAGSTSFINDVISAAGGKNLFSDLSEAYPMVSEETIIARQPEIILISAASGISAETVGSRAGWKNIPAVKNNCVYIIDDNLFTRPGPRIADAVQTLSELISK